MSFVIEHQTGQNMGTALLAFPEQTINSLNQVVSSLDESAEALADKASNRFLREVAERKIEREEELYRTQHGQLLAQYRSQTIAMHYGQVLDADSDELVLFLRIRQAYPMVGILIKRMTEAVEEVWTIRSPRLEYHK